MRVKSGKKSMDKTGGKWVKGRVSIPGWGDKRSDLVGGGEGEGII